MLQQSSPDISIATSDIAVYFNWICMNETLGSDHVVIKISMCYDNSFSQFIKKRNYKKANWPLYKKYIDSKLFDFNLPDDPQSAYDMFLNIINESGDMHIPYIKFNQGPLQQFTSKPYWKPELSKAIAERRLALKVFRKNPTPNNLITLKVKISSSQRLIRKAKRESWVDFCSSINESSKLTDMWRRMKWLKGYKSPSSHIDKTNAYNLLQSLTPDYVTPKSPIFCSYNEHLEQTITLCELEKCIKLKDTSPGHDNISYSMIKNLSTSARDILVNIIIKFCVVDMFLHNGAIYV
ncbi:unnamed protein product [Arctia plantaginis]|uniref:Uncharacterized protein n=1 Tax=Arctia plantaginis TaxID=874455 RepID=A0A8S1AGL6_ARCPL|nr:unnamed protein product [Arctia plantaginis]